jgi:hypothetical protein
VRQARLKKQAVARLQGEFLPFHLITQAAVPRRGGALPD